MGNLDPQPPSRVRHRQRDSSPRSIHRCRLKGLFVERMFVTLTVSGIRRRAGNKRRALNERTTSRSGQRLGHAETLTTRGMGWQH